MRRLQERQPVSLAVPTRDPEPLDVDCVVLLTEADMALLQTRMAAGVQATIVDGVSVIGFVHEGRPVMLRGTAQQLTPSLFTFRVSDGVGVRQPRGRTRLQVRVPVVVRAPDAADMLGWTIDLSRSGAALELPSPPASETFELTLRLPPGDQLVLTAQVVRDTASGLAVTFPAIADEAARRLESFILTEKARALWTAA